MEDENNLVRVESEDGEFLDMLILKEFDYKNKKYAVLMEVDSCKCGDDCGCDDDCDNNGHCGDKCDCGCEHEDEKALCILEITKDKDNNEIFKSIDDENLYDEIIEEAEKKLYEE